MPSSKIKKCRENAIQDEAFAYVVGNGRCTIRHIFVKKDCGNNLQNTLAVSNVPPYINEEGLKKLLSHGSEKNIIEKIVFNKTNARCEGTLLGYWSGTAIFSSSSDLDTFLSSLANLKQEVSMAELGIELTAPLGIKKYVRRYNNQFVGSELLQKAVENVVIDDKNAQQEVRTKKRKSEPDEEGWIKVTKHDKHSFRAERNFGNITSSS